MRFHKRSLYVNWDKELMHLWSALILMAIAIIILGSVMLINGLRTRTAEAATSQKIAPVSVITPEVDICTNSDIKCPNELDKDLPYCELLREANFKDFGNPDQIKFMIRFYASKYGVNPERALEIAECESRFNPKASNPESTAKGVYQFLDGTWEQIGAKGHQFDAPENIKQFMLNFPKHKNWWKDCL